NPAIILSVVVLPQPDGPSMVKNSPAGMSMSIPSTATTSWNCFVSSSRRTSPGTASDLQGGRDGGILAAGEAPVDEVRQRERREGDHERDRRERVERRGRRTARRRVEQHRDRRRVRRAREVLRDDEV